MPYNVRDANLKQTKALPTGASSVSTTGFDLEHSTKGEFQSKAEILISAPALTTGMLADAATMKYKVEMDDNASFSSATTLIVDAIVQTGAGGAGAAAATYRFRLPTNVERYVRVTGTKSASGDASSLSMTVEVLV